MVRPGLKTAFTLLNSRGARHVPYIKVVCEHAALVLNRPFSSVYLHQPSIPLQTPHSHNAPGLFLGSCCVPHFLTLDAQLSHALAGVLTRSHIDINSIEMDRKYHDRPVHLS